MGLLPVNAAARAQRELRRALLLRQPRPSSYGTAGYLGNGYFITVKHARRGARQEGAADRAQDHVGQDACTKARRPARVVDSGDARVEVDPGDWAIIKVKEPIDLPAAAREPGFRVRVRGSDLPPRQRLLEGDHPVDRLRRAADAQRPGDLPDRRPPGRLRRRRARSRGELVGIPIGRMQGDYRFSFILPMRAGDVPEGHRYPESLRAALQARPPALDRVGR